MRKLFLGFLVLILTACGGAANGGGDDSTGAAPAASAPAASSPVEASAPAAEASSAPATGSGFSTDGTSDSATLEARAMSALSAQLNQPASALTLVSKEQQEWSDGSLGCPQPGMMYTQAIVPGYKLTYDDGSRKYDVHTDERGSKAVWCDNGQAKEIEQP